MKWLITGGNQGLGKYIADQCSHNSFSVSRANGFDIKDVVSRERIAQLSLDYDVFINNAFDGPPHKDWADFGQTKLLYRTFELWADRSKTGYIFNIGSYATQSRVEQYNPFEFYRVAKLALDHASFQATNAFYKDNVPFRTTLIRPGRLDTEKSRNRPNWSGNGHALSSLFEIINTCINMPKNTCVRDININVNLLYQSAPSRMR